MGVRDHQEAFPDIEPAAIHGWAAIRKGSASAPMKTTHRVRPVFVGGSGRSGTTITGQLLGSHAHVWSTFPREVRFITDPGGLLDLVLGGRTRIQHLEESLPPGGLGKSIRRTLASLVGSRKKREENDLEGFLRGMRGRWWLRTGPTGTLRGLHRGFARDSFLEHVAAFEVAYPRGAREAAAELVDGLLGGKAAAEGATAFVDTTPPNAENAHRIIALFPDAKVLHLVRDGRDTAASVVRKKWGPDRHLKALQWWYERTLRAHQSLARCPAESVLEVNMDALVLHDRDRLLERLFAFLGYEPDENVRRFFSERVSADKAHQGRWRQEVSPTVLGKFDETYGRLHQALTAAGVPMPSL